MDGSLLHALAIAHIAHVFWRHAFGVALPHGASGASGLEAWKRRNEARDAGGVTVRGRGLERTGARQKTLIKLFIFTIVNA